MEIDIVAQATVLRKDKEGELITDSDELIRCTKVGNPLRNSDPRVNSSPESSNYIIANAAPRSDTWSTSSRQPEHQFP